MALLRFTCKDANVTIRVNFNWYNNIFQYRKNGTGSWSGFTSVNLTPGEYIELIGEGFDDTWSTSESWSSLFVIDGEGKIEGSGDITSLLNGIGGDVAITKNSQFVFLFRNCTNLTTAPNLPSTTLASDCYRNMFDGCTNLTTAPELPATNLAEGCYYYMFCNCSNINYVKIGAESPSPLNMTDWLYNTASTGTLEITNNIMQVTENSSSSLPTGWSLERTSSTPDPDPTPSEPTTLDNVKVCGQSIDLSSGTAVVTIPEFSTFTIDAHGLVDANGDPVLVKVSGASEVKVNESVQKSWTSKTITLTTVSSK